MKNWYLCHPKRNKTCRAVFRTEGKTLVSTDPKEKFYRGGKFTVACTNPWCKHTSHAEYAKRFLGIPLVDLGFTIEVESALRRSGGGGGNNKKGDAQQIALNAMKAFIKAIGDALGLDRPLNWILKIVSKRKRDKK